MNLIYDVHVGLEEPTSGQLYTVTSKYDYYHYKCDGFNDVGWGCGYRTLQTMCSWMKYAGYGDHVPSITEIQQLLINMEDKPKSFFRSRDWIGSFEVCLVIDKLFDVPCKIMHIPSGKDLITHFHGIEQHFKTYSSPVMMGGNTDAASKGILGTCSNNNEHFLLVLDPHYHRDMSATCDKIQTGGFVKWVPLEEFCPNSFYNLCMPIVKKVT